MTVDLDNLARIRELEDDLRQALDDPWTVGCGHTENVEGCQFCRLEAERDQARGRVAELEAQVEAGNVSNEYWSNLWATANDRAIDLEAALRKAKRLLVDMLATGQVVRDDVFEETIDGLDATLASVK